MRQLFTDKLQETRIETFESGKRKELALVWLYDEQDDKISIQEGAHKETVLIRPSTGKLWGACVQAPDAESAKEKAKSMIDKYIAEWGDKHE